MMTLQEVSRLLEVFPQAPLGHYPTPLEPAPRLGDELGLDLQIKRDDATGLAFGGNKIRQLEFYMGKARELKADTILITGAVQSNYVRAAAAAAAKLGLRCHVQLEDRVPLYDESYVSNGNVLLDKLLGATVHTYPEGEDEAGADARLHEIAEEERRQGFNPYVIPLSPGNPPIGALGYVKGALELVVQLEDPGSVDAFVVPSGSGMTHGGFLVGGEPVDVRGPALGALEEFELGNEVLAEAGAEAGFHVERGAVGLGPARGEGEGEATRESFPVGVAFVFPAAEPFEPVRDVADLVAVDAIEDGGGLGVAEGVEDFRVVAGVVEIGLLESEAEAGDVIHGCLHGGDCFPEVTAHGKIAEVDAALLHAGEIHAGVALLLEEGGEDAAAKLRGGGGKLEKDERHELGGEELVIGEEVEKDAALFGVAIELVRAGEGSALVLSVGAQAEFGGAARGGGRGEGGARLLVGEFGRRRRQFLLKGGGLEDFAGEFV